MKKIFKSNVFGLFILLGLTCLLIWITNRYILTINFYANSGEPVSGIPGQEEQVYQLLQKWIYLGAVVYLLAKLFLISLVLYTALYLSEQTARFKKIFNIVLWSEFIFFIPAIIKMLWFPYHYPGGTLTDWYNCYILSVLSLFGSVPADYHYALQTLNVFELAYWFLLARGLAEITQMNYDRSLKMVVFSYVPALFIWVCVVTFCALLMFPATG